jgi:N-acetylmuramoyl-L-alanine amidase
MSSNSKFKISRHRLHREDGTACHFSQSPNKAGKLEHKYLVLHYTSGPSAQSAINWFSNREAKASAHLVIDRDGTITQMVSFDTIAWHAGTSSWEGLTGLNRYSLGIELVNAGKLNKSSDKWRAWFGTLYDSTEVIEAVHKNETIACGWHIYPQLQLEAALEVARLLVRHYKLLDIVGHEDISPGRKTDPGPAFPMNNFKSKIIGRAENEGVHFETTTHLNIRTGPGTEFLKIIDTPLPPGTVVEIVDAKGSWRLVDVLEELNGINDLLGWVHGSYLRRKA